MQNFIITLILLLLSFFVSAQEEPEKFNIAKGTWSLEGSLGINAGNSEEQSSEIKNFGFSLRPAAGYFFNDNLSAGLLLGYDHSSSKYKGPEGPRDVNNRGFIIAPYLQKYFGISGAFAFNLTGSLEYNWSRNTSDYDNCLNCSENTRNIYAVVVRPGISYLLSDKFSLDANLGRLGYNYSEMEDEDQIYRTTNSFNFSFSLSNIYLGLTYYFN